MRLILLTLAVLAVVVVGEPGNVWSPTTGCTGASSLLQLKEHFRSGRERVGGGLNPFQQFLCAPKYGYKDNSPYGETDCMPQYRPADPAKPVAGIVVGIHGFTACTQQFNNIAAILAKEGYEALQPLIPGHGQPYGCDAAKGGDCVGSYSVKGLPKSKEEFIAFTKAINAAVQQHKDYLVKEKKADASKLNVVIIGLSAGGALAIGAALENPGLYTHVISYSPFFGITRPQEDLKIWQCVKDKNKSVLECITSELGPQKDDFVSNMKKNANKWCDGKSSDKKDLKIWACTTSFDRDMYKTIIEPPKLLPFKEKLAAVGKSENGWGAGCENARQWSCGSFTHRAGICSFRLENLFALHAYGYYIKDKAGKTKGFTKFLRISLAERDEFTRNSLTIEIAKAVSGAHGAATVNVDCYRRACFDKLFDNNECGVPHASLSYIDNCKLPPGNQNDPKGAYWLDALQSELVAYIGDPAGNYPKFTVDWASWDKIGDKDKRMVPARVDLANPPQAIYVGGYQTPTVFNVL